MIKRGFSVFIALALGLALWGILQAQEYFMCERVVDGDTIIVLTLK